jgi:hypothetical protein
MGFGVFIHRTDSIYDDSPAERYQFPSQYLGRVQACVGDWIIYYEPRKVVTTRGYFAVAKVAHAGGSVCLNSFGRFVKWISASIMPPPSLVPAR